MWRSLRFRLAAAGVGVLAATLTGLAIYLGLRVDGSAAAIGVASAVAIIAGTAASLAAAETIVRPLRRLQESARGLAAGRADARLVVGGPRELQELARALNQAAEALRLQLDAAAEERGRLEQTLAASADVVIAVDRAATVLYANPAAEARLELGGGTAVGRPLLTALPDHEIYQLARRAIEGGAGVPTLVRRAGRHFQVIAQPVAGGGEWAAVLVMHDVTALHEAEAARRDFVANVSHELRTPIASISAAAETLELGVPPEETQRFLHIIRSESDRMAQLVEEMLDLARLESGLAQPQLRAIDPRQIVWEAVQRWLPQAERAGLALRAAAEIDPGLVSADPDLIQRALANLLQNAIKFTPPPGTITVGTRRADAAVWLLVTDTGIGLSPEEQGRVFQRFYRVDKARQRAGGTGLGLALMRHIARLHGCDVLVESEVGHGSTFGFSLRAPKFNRLLPAP